MDYFTKLCILTVKIRRKAKNKVKEYLLFSAALDFFISTIYFWRTSLSLWRWECSPKTRLSQPEIPLVVFEELLCWTRTARGCHSLPTALQRTNPLWWTYCFHNPANLCQILSSHLLPTHKVIVGALACEE